MQWFAAIFYSRELYMASGEKKTFCGGRCLVLFTLHASAVLVFYTMATSIPVEQLFQPSDSGKSGKLSLN